MHLTSAEASAERLLLLTASSGGRTDGAPLESDCVWRRYTP